MPEIKKRKNLSLELFENYLSSGFSLKRLRILRLEELPVSSLA